MALAAMRQVYGDLDFSLLYDAPHNLLWKETTEDGERILHRKGACPARGPEAMPGTPFEYYGESVLVPGSMGASSFILATVGQPQSTGSGGRYSISTVSIAPVSEIRSSNDWYGSKRSSTSRRAPFKQRETRRVSCWLQRD